MWFINLVISALQFVQNHHISKITSQIKNVFNKLIKILKNKIKPVINISKKTYNFIKIRVLSFIVRLEYKKNKDQIEIETEHYIHDLETDIITESRSFKIGDKDIPEHIRKRLQTENIEIDYTNQLTNPNT